MGIKKSAILFKLCLLLVCSMATSNSYAQAARIMVVGDSISAGWNRPSFRMPLYNSLVDENCAIDMVGDQTKTTYQFYNSSNFPGFHFPSIDPSFGYPAGSHWDPALGDDTDHQAFPGIQTDELANGASPVSPIAVYVGNEQPDYILLQTGTNDLNAAIISGMRTDAEINTWANQTIAEIRLIVNRSIGAHQNPSTLKILIGNYIPNVTTVAGTVAQDVADKAAVVFSNKIDAFVESENDSRILLVDVASGFNINTMVHDGTHPNVIGENHIAGAFLTVLRGAGLCAVDHPAIVQPSVGSSVTGDSVVVNWVDNGVSLDRWRIYAGSTQSGNSADYFDSGYITTSSRSVTVTGLPQDGSNVFITLEYRSSGLTDITLSSIVSAAPTTSETDPELFVPVPGGVLEGDSATFRWRPNSTAVIQWWLRLGSAELTDDYYSSGRIEDPNQLSEYVSGLPTNGETIYVSLYYKTPSGPWGVLQHVYTAGSGATDGSTDGTTTGGTTDGTTTGGTTDGTTTGGTTDGTTTGGGSGDPLMTSPVAGSVLPGSTATFNWSSSNSAINQWWVYIGSTPGASDYFNSDRISDNSVRSVVATGLPTAGETVHVTLRYKTIEPWADVRYTYTAASGSSDGSTTGGTTDGSTTGGTTDGGSTDGTTTGGTTDGGSTTGGGFEPPPLDLANVRWLHTDVSGWAETATLSSVDVTSSQVCLNYDKAGVWPVVRVASARDADLVGNPWVFMYNQSESAWYAATWEWLRPNQVCKAKSSVNGDHIKKAPYTAASGWEPTSGETVYFMVSGLARTTVRNVQARTKPVKVIWP